MNNKNKISVIMCAYNTEKYIEKSILSIMNQTYKNIELIVVDDGSSDNTAEVIRSLCDKYKNIKLLVNEKNSGAAYSRNRALKEVTGDYIGFIDSDDYIDENYYEVLYKNIISKKSDLVICDIMLVYEKNNTKTLCQCGNENNDKLEYINTGLAASSCNKLFKKEIIKNLYYTEGMINEDVSFVLPLIIKYNTTYTNEVYYYYVQREKSVQNSEVSIKKFDIFKAVEETLERIKNVDDYLKYKDAIVYQQIYMLFLYVIPKEKNIFRRAYWLKLFYKLSKKYDIKNNPFVKSFINIQGLKHKIYYKTILRLTSMGFAFCASFMILLFQIARKLTSKNPIKKNIDMGTLIECAKKQSTLTDKYNISVVIPNYNYEKFMFQRMYSILCQNIKINEILILDDCSTDNSRVLIDNIVDELSKYINITKVYNKKNSGSAFKQWRKGFELAKGDYVWIAEADDYCDRNFLKNITKPLDKDKNIVISYSDTAFMNTDGDVFMKTIKPEIDVRKTGHWNTSYVNSGVDEFNNYTFLNCTIANVSSVLFKKADYTSFFEVSGNYKQAGDWLFYANIMRCGNIAYCNKALNYYRVHGNNVSSVTKREAHMKEINSVHKYFDDNYGLSKEQFHAIDERNDFLKKVWKLK